MENIFAFCNHKGGVGKTTSAINVAAQIAKMGNTVLLVDADPQANATSCCGINPDEQRPNLYSAMRMSQPLTPVPVSDGWNIAGGRLDVIPSTLDLLAAESELLNEIGRERIMADTLATVRDNYDFILIDCPPSLGLLTINALTASDAVFVPLQPSTLAIDGLNKLNAIVGRIQRSVNPRLNIGGVFLTQYDDRVTIQHSVRDAISEAFGELLLSTTIRRATAVVESQAVQKPVVVYNPTATASADYVALTSEVMARMATIGKTNKQ